jgi:SAM-dependent methyltransferase
LYGLLEAGLLSNGTGIELSASRYEFAEAWKADLGAAGIKNINQDFTNVRMDSDVADWYVVIDNTFTYLEPESPDFPQCLLQQAYSILKPGGFLLLDLINYAKREKGMDYQQWVKFPESDPYIYGLYSNEIGSNNHNKSTSIYIKRDGTESHHVIFSRVYRQSEIEDLVSRHSFKVEKVFSDFLENNFEPAESDRMVVLARKL